MVRFAPIHNAGRVTDGIPQKVESSSLGGLAASRARVVPSGRQRERATPSSWLGSIREALTAFYDPGGFTSWYGEVIAALSVVGTVLFIFGSPWVALRGSRRSLRASACAALAAFIVNAQYYLLFDDHDDLRIGYFVWCLSFGVLAVGLFVLAGQKLAPPIAQDRTFRVKSAS